MLNRVLARIDQRRSSLEPAGGAATLKRSVKRKANTERCGETHSDHPGAVHLPHQELRLLSFNIQAGHKTSNYSEYVTKSWRQLVPRVDHQHLNQLSELMREFDMVALQEVDGGSVRSGFVNQLAYFAEHGQFDYWYQQLNRDLGRLGQFSNGLLCRATPYRVEAHRLPGLKGRGAIVARFGRPESPLIVIGLHLALSEKARFKQLEYVRSVIDHHKHVIIMGDMNCQVDSLIDTPLRDISLKQASADLHTFPSWSPNKGIDHILVTPSLTIKKVEVLPYELSDHRPIAMHVELPDDVRVEH